MIQFEYSSEELKNSNTKYILSSVIGEDNFFYGLYRPEDHRLMKAKLISSLDKGYFLDQEALKALFDEEKLNEDSVSQCAFAYTTAHFSIHPGELKLTDIREFADSFTALHHDKRYKLEEQELKEAGFSFHYILPKSIKTFLNERFKDPSIVHFNAALVSKTLETGGDYVLFNFYNNSFQTVVIKDSGFIQTNDYEIKGQDDALYYALLNCRNHDIEPAEQQFYISGTLDIDSPQVKLFLNHFRNIELFADRNRLHYANIFLGKSKHLFFDLDCVLSCV